jgi:hypothetical protein
VPGGHPAERRYILDLVLGQWLGLDYELQVVPGPDVVIVADGEPLGPSLRIPDVLFATPDRDWLTEASLPPSPAPRVGAALPLLYGRAGPEADPSQRTDDGITLAPDVFGIAFFLLTRYEEVVRRVRDDHERFPARASTAVREGFLERPLVDELVDLLWSALHDLWPGLSRPASAFRLRLSHDVD